jgi:hypothetical protein
MHGIARRENCGPTGVNGHQKETLIGRHCDQGLLIKRVRFE